MQMKAQTTLSPKRHPIVAGLVALGCGADGVVAMPTISRAGAAMHRGETCAESLHAVRACAAEGEMFQHELGIVTHAAPAYGPGYAYGATCKKSNKTDHHGGEH